MERYFLGSNTGYGFYGNYEDELKDKRKVILLKGGPGTGKSSMLKKLASEAKSRGMDYELWFCSGDPQSLDGVYIKDINTAVVDATAPHATGADLPKMKDYIFDLADNLSSDKLRPDENNIKELLKCKKQHFIRAYQHLKTALCHLSNEIELEMQGLKSEDIRAYAATVAGALRGDKTSARRRLFTSAICPSGESVYYDHLSGKSIYKVCGCLAARKVFFDELVGLLRGGTVVLNPLNPNIVDGYFTDVSAVVCDMGGVSAPLVENVNLDVYGTASDARGVDDERNSALTHIAFATSELERARECHLGAEKYFISAMDFVGNEKVYLKILKEIF